MPKSKRDKKISLTRVEKKNVSYAVQVSTAKDVFMIIFELY